MLVLEIPAIINPIPFRGMVMTRDMELVRKILLEVQARTDLRPRVVEISGYDPLIVERHVSLLFKALEGIPKPSASPGPPAIFVADSSWEGHDFISALNNDGVWAKMKQSLSAADLATLPLTIIKDAAVAALRQWTFTALGLPSG